MTSQPLVESVISIFFNFLGIIGILTLKVYKAIAVFPSNLLAMFFELEIIESFFCCQPQLILHVVRVADFLSQ